MDSGRSTDAPTQLGTQAESLTDAATTSTEWALELRGLRREFGDTVAVDDIDLRVPHGSFLGVVGPNGTGEKTTALSMARG